MLQSEVINKLTRECCIAMGDFDKYKTIKIYIQMALTVGIEHFSNLQEEIVALYMDGAEAGRFKSSIDASIKLGIHRQDIVKVINGRGHSAGGLMFMKTKDYELVKKPPWGQKTIDKESKKISYND